MRGARAGDASLFLVGEAVLFGQLMEIVVCDAEGGDAAKHVGCEARVEYAWKPMELACQD